MGVKSNSRIEEYINGVCGYIKFKEVHREIKLELESHIYEIVDEYMSNGLSEEEAVEKAITQMGDSVTVGKQLNASHKVKPDLGILVTVAVLLSVGLIALYSMETVIGAYKYLNTAFNRTIIIAIISIIIGSLMYFFDYKKLKPYCKHMYLINLIIIVFVTVTGSRVNGNGYLFFGSISLNYIYISPWIFVIAYAGILKEWRWDRFINSFIAIALLLVPFVMYLSSHNAAVAAIYFAALIVVAIAARANLISIFMLIGVPVVSVIYFLMGEEYRIQRFIAILHYKYDPMGTGYMYAKCTEAVKSAGFLGKGFKAALQIPEIKTDFIFTYIVYSFGWIAGIIVVAVAVLFVIRLVRVANMVKDSFGKIMIKGFIAIFAAQFAWNVLMNLGLVPFAEVALPFISYGGSQLMASMIVVGIISSIFRRKALLDN